MTKKQPKTKGSIGLVWLEVRKTENGIWLFCHSCSGQFCKVFCGVCAVATLSIPGAEMSYRSDLWLRDIRRGHEGINEMS